MPSVASLGLVSPGAETRGVTPPEFHHGPIPFVYWTIQNQLLQCL